MNGLCDRGCHSGWKGDNCEESNCHLLSFDIALQVTYYSDIFTGFEEKFRATSWATAKRQTAIIYIFEITYFYVKETDR